MSKPPLKKDTLLTEPELDNAVYDLIREALSQGMIPIAGIMSRRQSDGRHKILGFGWNHLREGIPGIHGETGAIMNMGRLKGGYRDVIATSSLSPCPFCQCCLALHLGIKEIRILDAINYRPDFAGYEKVGLNPVFPITRRSPPCFANGCRSKRMPRSGIATSASGIASTRRRLT